MKFLFEGGWNRKKDSREPVPACRSIKSGRAIREGSFLKNVSQSEDYFTDHFPDSPIMPGVLILEALAQAGGILVHLRGQKDKIAVLLSVNQAKFRQPVKPGDVLILKCEGLHFSSKGGRVKAEALVDGKVAAEAEIGFVFVDKSQI